MGRAVMVVVGSSRIVGIPKYMDAKKNGLDPEAVVIDSIDNCVEMFVLPTPIIEGGKQVGIGMSLIGVVCGSIVEYEGAIVVDLENDSPYYLKYAEITAGIVPNPGAEMRPIRRH